MRWALRKKYWSVFDLATVPLFTVTALLLPACGEKSSTGGGTVAPPVVTINCTTNQCKTNSVPVIYVRVTQSSCAPAFDNWAIATASMRVNCDGTRGCYAPTTTWVDAKGNPVSAIPSGAYTICGRIDYNNDYPANTSDDTTGSMENLAISQSGQSVLLTNWVDP